MSTYRLDTGSVADWQITQRLGGNCLQGGLLDACDCYGFQPWVDR